MNDTTALGAMRAIREAGLEVPRDVSVVGFDDGELAEFSHPRLTTIHQPRLQMGREGACRLIALLKNEAAVESVVLDVHLVTRESTCPPR
jgi:LacI family transcriptional regulator